jgi:putative membrane protein
MSSQRVIELLVRWLLLALAVWVAAELLSGIHLEGWKSTLIVAAILGLLNLYLRPILVLFSLPVTILTLGFFLVIINALLLLLTSWIAEQFEDILFHVDNIGAAILGAIIISLVGLLLGIFIKPARLASRF